MIILRKNKEHSFKGRKEGEKEGEGSSAYHHSTDIQTKMCRSGPSRRWDWAEVKPRRWRCLNGWTQPAAAKEDEKKKLECSGCNLLRWQRWKEPKDQDEKLQLPNREEVNFSEQIQWRHYAGGQSRSQVADRKCWVDGYRAVDDNTYTNTGIITFFFFFGLIFRLFLSESSCSSVEEAYSWVQCDYCRLDLKQLFMF